MALISFDSSIAAVWPFNFLALASGKLLGSITCQRFGFMRGFHGEPPLIVLCIFRRPPLAGLSDAVAVMRTGGGYLGYDFCFDASKQNFLIL